MEGMNAPPSQFFGSHSFVTPLVISVIGTISTAIALLFYHYILVNYFCFRRQQRHSQVMISGNNIHQPAVRPLLTGVDKKILETIPIVPYETKKGYLFRVDQTECVVCLGELEHGEMVRLLPTCKHAFHVPCIDRWFVSQNNCPICRLPLTEPVSINYPATLFSPPCAGEITRDYYNQRPAADPPDNHDHQNSHCNTDVNVVIDDNVNYNCATSSSSSSSLSGHQQSSSSCLLRHTSVALPVERKKHSRKRRVTGLKRSLSMDQSSVFIQIQSEINGRDCSSSSSPVTNDHSETTRLYRAPSLRNSDRVSAKLLKSLSRFTAGRNNEILPY